MMMCVEATCGQTFAKDIKMTCHSTRAYCRELAFAKDVIQFVESSEYLERASFQCHLNISRELPFNVSVSCNVWSPFNVSLTNECLSNIFLNVYFTLNVYVYLRYSHSIRAYFRQSLSNKLEEIFSKVSSCRIGLFSRVVRLFAQAIGLFSRVVRHFAQAVGLFSRVVRLFAQAGGIFWRATVNR